MKKNIQKQKYSSWEKEEEIIVYLRVDSGKIQEIICSKMCLGSRFLFVYDGE